MEVSKSTEVKVGILIGIGLALFMITTLLLGGSKRIFSSTYQLKVQLDSVAGVAPGSVVQVLGIPVGNVRTITFVPDDRKLEVQLDIEKNYQPRITQGSVAGVRTQGALGDKYIFITPGPESAPALQDGQLLETEQGGDLFTTLSQRGDEFNKIFTIIDQAHTLLNNLNANGRSAQLMNNLVDSSAELKGALTNLNLMMADLRGPDGKDIGKLKNSLAHLESVLMKIDKGQGTLGSLINDSEIHERIKAVLGGSSQSSFMKNQVRETIRVKK